MMFLPLFFVVTVNGLKDFFEDFKRKQSDNRENNSTCTSLRIAKKSRNNKEFNFKETLWKDLTPGQIVKINKDENFPADLIMIYSSNKNGSAFTETKNLDGETNLKYKESIRNISFHLKTLNSEERIIEEIKQLEGYIDCDDPNPYLYEFSGILKLKRNFSIDEVKQIENPFLSRRQTMLDKKEYNKNISNVFQNILNSGK